MSMLSKLKKKAVSNKTQNKCGYCGVELNDNTLTIDHVKPKRIGGTNDISNLMPSCRACNSSKLTKSIKEWRLYITFNKATRQVVYGQQYVNHIHSLGLFPAFGVTEFHEFYFEVKE